MIYESEMSPLMKKKALVSPFYTLMMHEDMYAMVVSTEVTGQNAYRGDDINKIIINCVSCGWGRGPPL